jgi:hypothetical protein
MNKKVLISGLVLKLAFLTATAAFGQTPSFTPTPCQSLNYVFVGSANQGLAYDANANPYPTGWQSATYTPGSGWNPAQELSMPAVSNCGTGMISLIAAAPTPGPSQTFLHRNVFNLPSNTFFNNVPPTLVLGAADLAGVFSGGSAWVTVGVWMNNNLVGNFPLNAGCSIITVPSADFQTGTNVLAIQAWGGQWEVLDYSMPLSIVGCPAASPTASTTVTATFTRTPTLTPVNTSTVTPTATGANCCQGVSLALDQASYGNANGLGMDYAHNRVYVTDAENHVVKVYDLGTNGFLPDLTTGLSFPRDASLDGDGLHRGHAEQWR